MNNLKHVRMLTSNFSAYQGLKGVPLGLLLLVISLWASAKTGPAPALFFPVGISIVFIYLFWVVDQYYNRVFGMVVLTKKQKIINGTRDALIGTGALIAFWVDVSKTPSFSMLGFIFAGAIVFDYVRISRHTNERLLLFYPISALLMIALSLLPVFGINWWIPLGIKALILGVCAAAGLVFSVLGILVHISFENLLLHTTEVSGE